MSSLGLKILSDQDGQARPVASISNLSEFRAIKEAAIAAPKVQAYWEEVSNKAAQQLLDNFARIETRGAEDDKAGSIDDTEPMSELSRDELNAHLENQNLKVDARLKSFEQTVKDAMGEIRLEMSGIRGDLKAVEADLGHLKDIKSSMRNTTLAIVGAIVASTLTIYFGIQSSNSSLVSSTIAGFGVGKDIATAQATMSQQTKDTQAILQQIQEQQKAQRSTAPPTEKSK